MDIANVSVRTSLVNLYAPMGELMGCKQVDGREGKWVLRKCVCVDEYG